MQDLAYMIFGNNTKLEGAVDSVVERHCREMLMNCRAGQSPTTDSLTRASAELISWDREILGMGMRDWRAAP